MRQECCVTMMNKGRRWGLAGAEGREQLLAFCIITREFRMKPDGSSVALLSAVWLRILFPELPEITEMIIFL